MKTISLSVSDVLYREFQDYAKAHDRSAAELIRQAMAEFKDAHLHGRGSVYDIRPVSVGKVLKPWAADDDILGEMLDADRN